MLKLADTSLILINPSPSNVKNGILFSMRKIQQKFFLITAIEQFFFSQQVRTTFEIKYNFCKKFWGPRKKKIFKSYNIFLITNKFFLFLSKATDLLYIPKLKIIQEFLTGKTQMNNNICDVQVILMAIQA